MNVAALQQLDRRLGAPVCWVLTLARRLGGRSAPPAAGEIRRVLFLKLAEQGSTVLAVPAIRRAVTLVGRENVFFLVFADNRFILEVLGLIPTENVATISAASPSALLRTSARAVRQIRRWRPDAAVDLEFFSRGSAALAWLSGARVRVGFHTWYGDGPYRGDLMTHRLLYNPHLHTAQTFQLLVEALQHDPAALPRLPVPPPPADLDLPAFSPQPGEREAVRALLARQSPGADTAPLILLNPNASDLLPLRKWPLERYGELARRLLARYPELFVVITGGPTEAQAAAQLAAAVASPRCVSLAGKTTLRELLVLFTLAEVLVTNDSGPAQFAALTPIHVVTLFGPETPRLYGARTPRHHALWAGPACSPCVNAYNNRQSPCTNNVCLLLIAVDEVYAAVCAAYDGRRAGSR